VIVGVCSFVFVIRFNYAKTVCGMSVFMDDVFDSDYVILL
jgi:hypothetical protein